MAVKGIKIAVIGGGSSYTPELIEGLIKRHEELPVREIYLDDIDEGKDKLEIIVNLSKRMIAKAGLDISIHQTLNRREAIKDADFVVTQFRVGQLDARIRDEKIPLKYGTIGQETTGAGGFANAQRTIPVTLDICKDIERLAPNAWMINFTNPSGIITEAVLKHTNVKAAGLCNVPIGMVNGIADILGVAAERINIDFMGLNHLIWGRKVYLDGMDITNKIINEMTNGKYISLRNIPDMAWDPDFIKSLGMLPCSYLRYYYLTDEMLKEEQEAAAKEGTRGEVVKKIEHDLFKIYKNPDLNVKPPQLSQRGGAHYSDAACSLINSIYNNKKDIQTINLRNNGAIADLPDNVVIEANSIIGKNNVTPVNMGHIPVKIRGLIQAVKAYEELTVEAGVTGSYYAALQALTIHPLIPSAAIAKKLLDDIIRENKEYLPQYK